MLSPSFLHCFLWRKPGAMLGGTPMEGSMWVKHGCISSEAWQWPPKWAWKQALPQLSPVMAISLADDLVIVLRDPGPGPEASQPRFRTYRKCEIIYVCSFQWLTLGISCYTDIHTSTRYNWIPYAMSKICQPYKGLNYELLCKGQCGCSLNWFPRWCNFVRYSLPLYAKNSSHFPLVSKTYK